ncbi:MAG TPA: MGMT family protein [Spirochaetia bacterium]|nr:MGMT family protein [Spirochaetales bacterium]HRY79253.1 MGMT family protein [Spirochaetia bacterium]
MTTIERLPPVRLWIRESGGAWYGVAECDGRLAASSSGRTREEAERVLTSCIPPGAPRTAGIGPSDFADDAARRLAALEAGGEPDRGFELAPEYYPEPAASVYRLAAAVPPGYAASYGGIARAAGTIAREVGRLMAGNPLYPLVPCHRVVGSDYALVGYRGATSGPDLRDKLERLRSEARGFREEVELPGAGGLRVFPVEWVLAKADLEGDGGGQPELW